MSGRKASVGTDFQSDISLSEESGSRATRLAHSLRQAILDGALKLGEPFPPERELMEEYGVSRTTVREALRALATQGLVEVRRGRKGGSYVSGPSTQNVRSSLDLLISGQRISHSDLVEVREAIEPVAARQAALNRSEEEVHGLLELTRAGEQHIGDFERFSQINLDWHMGVVRASHNPLFIAFMTSISQALHAATSQGEFDLQTRKLVVAAHWKAFEAIRDRDPAAAQRRLARHVEAYGRHATEKS